MSQWIESRLVEKMIKLLLDLLADVFVVAEVWKARQAF